MPPQTHAESRALGGAAYALCVRLAEETLRHGIGVLIEAAFSRGSGEDMLAPLVALSRAVLIHLASSSQLSSDRFRARYERGERHPSHLDQLTVATPGDLWERGWARWERPLELGIPALVVDTSQGFVSELGEILAFVRASTEGHKQEMQGPTIWARREEVRGR